MGQITIFSLHCCASVNGLLFVLTLGCSFLALIPQYSDSPSTAETTYWRGIHSIVQHVNNNVNMQFFLTPLVLHMEENTVCPGSSDPNLYSKLYIYYYIKWVTTS